MYSIDIIWLFEAGKQTVVHNWKKRLNVLLKNLRKVWRAHIFSSVKSMVYRTTFIGDYSWKVF